MLPLQVFQGILDVVSILNAILLEKLLDNDIFPSVISDFVSWFRFLAMIKAYYDLILTIADL